MASTCLLGSIAAVAACTGDDPDVGSSSGGSSDASSGNGSSGSSGAGSAGNGPPAAPTSVSIFDDDMTLAKVRGTLVIGKATDEANVKEYVLFWGTDATTRTAEIKRVPKVGNDVSIPFEETVPANATHLLVAAANANGDLSSFVFVAGVDNVATHTSVDTEVFSDHAMIEVNGNLLIAAKYDAPAQNNYLSLKRCPVAGGACTALPLDVSFEQRGFKPSFAVDTTNNKLFVVTNNHNAFACALDGSGCKYQSTLPNSTNASTSTFPSGGYDKRTFRLLVAGLNEDSTTQDFFRLYLFRCALDSAGITACNKIFISTGEGGPPSMFVDDAPDPSVLYAVYAKANKATLSRCPLTSGSTAITCTEHDVSSGETLTDHRPQALFDKKNSKLLVVAESQPASKPSLYRCNLDGTGCTKHDVSAGQPEKSGHLARAALDTVHDKLLVVTKNEANTNKLSLFRCNLDGSGCVHADISAGQSLGAANSLAPVFAGNRLFVAAGPTNSLYSVVVN